MPGLIWKEYLFLHRYNGTGFQSGMSIIEHGVLSGFEVDLEAIQANVQIMKKEVDDKNVYIYLNEVQKSFLFRMVCDEMRIFVFN